MEDLSAASVEDVKGFFRSLLRARKRHLDHRRRLRSRPDQGAGRAVLRADSRPARRSARRPGGQVRLAAPQRIAMEAKIQQPQLYVDYPSPANFAPGDRELDVLANVLGNGKSSRLYKRLVYELKIAQSVTASQQSQLLASTFEITASPMPGHTLDEILAVIDEEIAALAGQARRRRRARSRQEPDRVRDRAQPRAPAGPRRAAPVATTTSLNDPGLPDRGPPRATARSTPPRSSARRRRFSQGRPGGHHRRSQSRSAHHGTGEEVTASPSPLSARAVSPRALRRSQPGAHRPPPACRVARLADGARRRRRPRRRLPCPSGRPPTRPSGSMLPAPEPEPTFHPPHVEAVQAEERARRLPRRVSRPSAGGLQPDGEDRRRGQSSRPSRPGRPDRPHAGRGDQDPQRDRHRRPDRRAGRDAGDRRHAGTPPTSACRR